MVDKVGSIVQKRIFDFVLIGIFLIAISYFVFATTTMNLPVASGNYSTPLTINITVDANEANNMTNITCYYNSSGGAATSFLTEILNDSASDTEFANTTISTTSLNDSLTYNISCNVYNLTTLNQTISRSITIDNTAPNVTFSGITNAVNNGNYSGTIVINVSVNDSTIGISSVYFNITNSTSNQHNFTLASTSGGGYYNLTLNTAVFTDGIYNITVYANDTLNNLNKSEKIKIRIDNSVPSSVEFGTLSDGNASYLARSYILYNISATDGGVGINMINVTLYNSTGGILNSSTSSSSSSATSFSYYGNFSGLSPGTYKINATVNDTLGFSNSTSTTRIYYVKPFFYFNGTTYDTNRVALNNSNVSVSVIDSSSSWTAFATYSTNANASGWFNLALPGNATDNYMYQLKVRHTNSTYNFVDYVGQTLPQFPYQEFSQLYNVNFYMKQAGTMNITVRNSSNVLTTFAYQVKDTKLGYPVSDCSLSSSQKEATCYVPLGRNYSIMVYPSQGGTEHFVPVSFSWNNFSDSTSYNVTDNNGANLSSFNGTSKILQKQFNITESFAKITGYIQNSTGGDFADWKNFTIVPFLSEPGNMIFMTYGILPWNASAWDSQQSDFYNVTNGFYNITVPYSPAETVNYILFAAAQNSTFMGSYRNITVSGSVSGFNFTMYELMGSESIINMSDGSSDSGGRHIVNTKRQTFNLVNATSNLTLTQTSAHIEATVDYSNYNCKEFTFMEDISPQTGNATFSLPLINNTGVKEINVYSQTYAPKRVPTKTATQINSNPNISMATFNPGGIGTSLSGIQVALYQSNSTCDVPSPPSSCIITDSTNLASFNPFGAVISGGAISFRMGLLSSGIIVHYVNVDMLASGPPDALFDGSQNSGTTTGSFETAFRFGSNGPTIYDYVLISMPYTEGSTTQTGLNESADVNMSIPVLYDENWQVIWNATANGTSGSALAGNNSHYNTHSSAWGTLMTSRNCTINSSSDVFNVSNPCFINKTSNKIWIRLPHFSGTKPSVTGAVITATSSSSSSSSSGGGSANTTATWKMTFVVNDEQFVNGYTKDLEKNQRIKVNVDGDLHYAGVSEITSTTVKITVWSEPQNATLSVGDIRRFDVDDDGYYDIQVVLNSISGSKANLTFKSINEKITEETIAEEEEKESVAQENQGSVASDEEEEMNLASWMYYTIIGIVIVLIIVVIIIIAKNKDKKNLNRIKVVERRMNPRSVVVVKKRK